MGFFGESKAATSNAAAAVIEFFQKITRTNTPSMRLDDDEDEDDDDTGDFDAYLQDYIDRYTDSNKKHDDALVFETKLEDIIQTAEGIEDDEAAMQTCRRQLRPHRHHNKRKHYHKSTESKLNKQNKKRREKNYNRLEFYENQLNLIKNSYKNFDNNLNQCKLFALSKRDQAKRDKKILKMQRAIKLFKNIDRHQMNAWNNLVYILNMTLFFYSNNQLILLKFKEKNIKNLPEYDKETRNLFRLILLDTFNSEPAAAPTEIEKPQPSCEVKPSCSKTLNPSVSLIEQIKQKAQFLADTKLIDKVSISSSNNDDNDLSYFRDTRDPDPDEILNNKHDATKYTSSDSLTSSSSSSSSDSSLYSTGLPKVSSHKPTHIIDDSAGSSIYFDQEDDCENHDFECLNAKTSKLSTASSSCSSFASLIMSLSSLNTITTSASSSSSYCSSSESSSSSSSSSHSASSLSSYYSGNFQSYIKQEDDPIKLNRSTDINKPKSIFSKNKRMQRQQRLLDKVANLGSSPINVIQSIAAKALNFKLRNSATFVQEAQDNKALNPNEHSSNHLEETATRTELCKFLLFY